MSRVRVTGEGLITGDGISGFATRSDLARMRELQRHGLQMAWYDEKVQEQNNLCADCHKQETSRLGNGKRRPLGLGFNESGQPSRLICTNCASKQRKARMEERHKPQDYASFEDFWQTNREQLQKEDAITLMTLRERDQDVSELYTVICTFLRCHDGKPCFQLTDALDEVERELVENSTTDLDQLSAPFYRVEHRHVFDEIHSAAEFPDAPKHARNAAVFAKYGLLQALPVFAGDHVVREFLRRNGRWPYPDWSNPSSQVRVIKCTTYHCPSEFQYNIHDRVPGWYFSEPTNSVVPPPVWFCDSCRAKSAARKPGGLKPRPEDVLYVAGGKMDDLQSRLPDWFPR